MKKLLCLATLVCTASITTANAAEKSAKGYTLETFLAGQKAKAEKKGKKYDEAERTKKFKSMDANNDGFLSFKEIKAQSKK